MDFYCSFVCAFDSLLTWYCGRWIYRNDGLQAFVENFLKDHFLPAMFVDYRKCVQQAISSKNYFRILKHALCYVIFKWCNYTILMNYKANWLCLLCLINSHISNIWHWLSFQIFGARDWACGKWHLSKCTQIKWAPNSPKYLIKFMSEWQ